MTIVTERKSLGGLAELRQTLRLVSGRQRIDQFIQITGHHLIELVKRQLDAMIRDAPMGKL